MSESEKQLVYDWADAGAPLGSADEVPPAREFPDVAWRLGREPDQVVAMRDQPFVVPAQGTVEYQYYVVDPSFTEDKWVKAAEIVPGNRSVVHHAIVFIRAPEGVEQHGLGWLTAYVPGQSTMELDDGLARRIPAGSKLIFQMHYTPAGSPQEDITKVGIVFAKPSEVKEEVVTLMAINPHFEIPPHASDVPVSATLANLPAKGRLLALAPHMHVRGKSFRVEASPRKSASSESNDTLLSVPHYDFNWQHAYQLEKPLPLRGLQLEFHATFDNSEDNLVNPDPNITVRWGDQTWQEMMVAFCEVALPVKDAAAMYGPRPLTAAQKRNAENVVDRLMKRFDENGDGSIAKNETKHANAFLVFAFNSKDTNRDGRITREEALAHALQAERDKRDRARR